MRSKLGIYAVVLAALSAHAFAQTTEIVSVATNGAQGNDDSTYGAATISADGRFVAFTSAASNLVPGDTNGYRDVFVRDRTSGTTERAGVGTGGAELWGSWDAAISADGRYVAFTSWLATGGRFNIFVHDRQSGTTQLVSQSTGGATGDGMSFWPSISADGRFIAFASDATNLVAGDTNYHTDIFVRDCQNGVTQRVSVSSSGLEGDSDSYSIPSISADGRYVTFGSSASNLVAGDTNGWDDVFVHDLQTGTTELVSKSTAGVQGSDLSQWGSISADGRYVTFSSYSSNLVAGDTNGSPDVFVRDVQAGTTERVSVASGGAQVIGYSRISFISSDGRFVAFTSDATNLVPGDTNGIEDGFVHDRQTGTTERVSVAAGGAQANGFSYCGPFSSTGLIFSIGSYSTNLVAGDTNGYGDVFVHQIGPPPWPVATCSGDGSSGSFCPCFNLGAPGHGCENSAGTGGAVLSAAGSSSLSTDTLLFTSSGETPVALSIFLQGDAPIAATSFGDGLRCTGGHLKRLFSHSASNGVVSAPQPGDSSISARSAALGDALSTGATRYYQTYYRDPDPTFCPGPTGATWNISSGLAIVWN